MRVIGDGGHACVIRDLLDAMPLKFGDAYAVVAIGNNVARKRSREENSTAPFPCLVHPSAIVSPSAVIGRGTVILAGAVIQPHAIIGDFCIVNTGASVDHHCVLCDYVHVAPGARLCGCVEVGEGAWIGAGAVCVQGAKIEPWTTVKAGTVAKSPDWSERCQRLATHTK